MKRPWHHPEMLSHSFSYAYLRFVYFTKTNYITFISGHLLIVVVVVVFFYCPIKIYQSWLDKSTPHTKVRWVSAVVLILLFLLRVFLSQGWYIVTYALGIYHLNLFIAFLTPKIDPALDLDGKI